MCTCLYYGGSNLIEAFCKSSYLLHSFLEVFCLYMLPYILVLSLQDRILLGWARSKNFIAFLINCHHFSINSFNLYLAPPRLDKQGRECCWGLLTYTIRSFKCLSYLLMQTLLIFVSYHSVALKKSRSFIFLSSLISLQMPPKICRFQTYVSQ
jgi:hypothetical protein